MPTITVTARQGAPEETEADTRVVGLFEGEPPPDGPLAALVESGEAKAKLRKLAVTHENGGRRLLAGGVGQRGEVGPGKGRDAGGGRGQRGRGLGAEGRARGGARGGGAAPRGRASWARRRCPGRCPRARAPPPGSSRARCSRSTSSTPTSRRRTTTRATRTASPRSRSPPATT